MSVKKLNLKYRFKDKFLNIVLENYKDKINFILDSIYEADEVDTALEGYVPITRTINTTSPITGGGALSGNLTLSLGNLTWAGTANYLVGVQPTASNGWEYKSLLGTSNQITVTHAAVDAGDVSYSTITLATPQDIDTDADVVFDTCTLDNNGLHLLDTNASHDLIVTPGSDLTADRVLTLTTGDAARTLSIEADSIVNQDLSSDSTVTAFSKLTLSGLDLDCLLLSGTTSKLYFSGGTGDKGVTYYSTESASRYAMRFPSGSDVVELLNRAANGTVEIHANTATGGAEGDVKVVEIQDTDIILSNGIGLNLQEDITFTGATTENLIKIPDNLAVALDITEASNSYLKFVTTDSGEKVVFGKLFEAPTACKIGNLTLADGSITDSGGAISFGDENLSTTGTVTGVNLIVSQNSDTITLSHDGTDPYFKWSDGELTFITDEGGDTDTYFNVKGKGTGLGGLRCYDQNDAEWLAVKMLSGAAYFNVEGTSPGNMHFQYNNPQNIRCWQHITSGNPYFYVYGYQTGVESRWMRFGVTPAGSGVIDCQGEFAFKPASITVGTFRTTGLRLDDDILSMYGTGEDYSIGYHLATDSLQIVNGAILNSNIRLLLDSAGNWGFNQATFGTNAAFVLAVGNGTAPTTSPADCFQMYSADVGGATGKAGVHFRDEEGNVVSLGSGGVLMSGTARVIKKMYLNNAAFTKGGTAPTQVILGNLNGWEFDIGDDAVMTRMICSDWATGTDLTVKVCWYIDEAYTSDKEIQWRIDWSALPHDFSETVDSPTHSGQIDSGVINIPAVAKRMGTSTVGTISGASLSAGDMLGFTLSRIAVAGDDPTAKPTIHHLIIEYTADKLGTAT